MSKKSKAADFTRWLQRQLAGRGMRIDVTGQNDAQSRAAISEFQRALGLTVTGTATAETVAAVRTFAPSNIAAPTGTMSAGGSAMGGAPMELKRPEPILPRNDPSDSYVPPPPPPQDLPPGPPPGVPLTGPGGSPAAQFDDPAYANVVLNQLGGLRAFMPPEWQPKEKLNYTTGNSPLASGKATYTPEDDQPMPPPGLSQSAIQQAALAARNRPPMPGPPSMVPRVAASDGSGPPPDMFSEADPQRLSPPVSYEHNSQTVGLPWGRAYPDVQTMMQVWIDDLLGKGSADAASATRLRPEMIRAAASERHRHLSRRYE